MNPRNKKQLRNLRRNRTVGVMIFVALCLAGILCWRWYVHSVGIPDEKRTVTETVAAERHSDDSSVRTEKSTANVGTATAKTSDNTDSRPVRKTNRSTSKTAGRPTTETVASTKTVENLELPMYGDGALVMFNEEGRYTLLYDTLYRQASWVAYVLTASDVKSKRVDRTNNFIPDPEVLEQGLPTAYSSHYSGSGYDRGHLCPSADRATSRAENQATFFLSNISPQTPELNQGIWNELEMKVRNWAVKYDSLYVVTGGVLSGDIETISGGIGVPRYFYKALLTKQNGTYYSIGFILPNARHFSPDIQDYSVTIDSLETFTSIDFFHNLPDNIEGVVESTRSDKFWFGRAQRY